MNNLAGLMDRRVLLESRTSGQNGEPNPVWVPLATVWAAKKDEQLMRESPDGKTILATGRTTWTLRYRGDLTPLHRLTDLTSGVVYNIEGVSEVGRREATQLQTKRYNE